MGERTEPTDADRVRAVAGGDQDALRELYDRHAPWMRARLVRRCADPALVEDAIQDTFLAAWRGATGYQGSGDVGAWLWGIAIRRLVSVRRRRRPPDPSAPAVERRTAPSAEDEALADQLGGDLEAALARLDPELLRVFQACALDGLTSRDAGRLLGLPAGTVRSRMSRARTVLKEVLS